MSRSCPAIFVSAAGSSHGKTTVTAALARLQARQGRCVRVFKTGPDFLDPMILERACGHPVYQLDLWMGGRDHCRQLLYEAAENADLILVEGVMGLFDGEPCSADLAQSFGIPVVVVIDATGTAQTLGAIAHGLASFRPSLPFAGVLANSVATPRHAQMVKQGLPRSMHDFGPLFRDPRWVFPNRHLGLVQAEEIADLEERLERAADAMATTGLAQLPPSVSFSAEGVEPAPTLLEGLRIGIARDAAFSFLYPANLDLLRALGARLVFFSPLADTALPEVDSLYLPGGYPELHLQRLQDNTAMKASLHEYCRSGRPLYAECGGMLYLFESITDVTGQRAQMVGLLPGEVTLQSRLHGLGYQTVPTHRGPLRGHTFHHSAVRTSLTPAARAERLYDTSAGEPIYEQESVTASYVHNYFPSNPAAAAWLLMP